MKHLQLYISYTENLCHVHIKFADNNTIHYDVHELNYTLTTCCRLC